ncbi:tryptophan--tRNA ligase [Candidatus Gracilibacteria bacterium]|nr:tryptophan--tRNA ligase [Candidatus Gracilibacteria bacterium]
MKKKIILTGDRPTGPLHLGHYVGSLEARIALQNEYNQFVIIADTQALTDNAENPEKVRKNVMEVTLDYLAVGIDPNITTIFIQSLIPEIAELTMYYMNLVSVSRLKRNPTVKQEIKQRNFSNEDKDNSEDSIPLGFLAYPVNQAADITAFQADLVPVGEDQRPMIEQTLEIVRKFNRIYGNVLVEPVIKVPDRITRLPGIDGTAKMSKSLGNAIYLSDSPDVLKKKVMGMFTDPNHLNVSDPGNVEENPVFSFLRAFDPDQEALLQMEQNYQRGGLGDVKVKQHLLYILQQMLEPIRKRREYFAQDKGEIMHILEKGTAKAREVSAKTLSDVRKAMLINYF